MSHAPDDLLAIQRYCHDATGQDWASLGIVGDAAHAAGGGYHEGQDMLASIGAAPGPQYPNSDYSYTDAPDRDLAPPHDMNSRTAQLAGEPDAASAFDLGSGFARFLEFNAWMRARMLAGDPRTRDIREMIHTLDGRTVRRVDRAGVQPDWGDDSHLSHTHFSFFRDSAGRRAQDDNFLGMLREFFDGVTEVDVTPDQDRVLRNDERAVTGVLINGEATVWGLDYGDGKGKQTRPAWIVQQLNAMAKKLDAVSTAGVDLDALAAKVAALLPPVPSAAEIAEELAKRLGNG